MHFLGPGLGLLVFSIALFVLHRELGDVEWRDVAGDLSRITRGKLFSALGLTVLGYVILTGYDILGLRYVRGRVSLGYTMFTSFLSYVFSNNVGLSVFGAMAVRFRMYTNVGLTGGQIVRLVIFTSTSFWLGIFGLAGVVFVLFSPTLPERLPVPITSTRPIGVLLLAVTAGYIVFCAVRRAPLRVRQLELPIPPLGLALLQPPVGMLDWTVAASVLYLLLPAGTPISFPEFVAIFMMAQVAGLVSHVPGGLGVFETVILVMLSPILSQESIMGSLLIYRGVYYLLPFLVGALMMGAYELIQQRRLVGRLGELYSRWAGPVVADLLAIAVFAAGAVLLATGTMPSGPAESRWLDALLPEEAVALTHLLGSVLGVLLLFLSIGLHRRLDAAYWGALLVLACGAAVAYAEHRAWRETALLLAVMVAVAPCHPLFDRRSSLFTPSMDAGWFMAIAAVIGGSIWFGVLAHRHVEYAAETWWEVWFNPSVSRNLRGAIAASVATVAIALLMLLRPARIRPVASNADVLATCDRIVRQHPRAAVQLVLLGDKQILFNERRDAFIMYASSGQSWIALGDPVAPAGDNRELAWRYRELCDRAGVHPAFFQVSGERLPLYLDLGLAPLRIGEEAIIDLAAMTTDAHRRALIDDHRRRAAAAGEAFDVLESDAVVPIMDELRAVSDAWLAAHNVREKSFAIGRFDPAYITRFPVAVIRREGAIIAFANLWQAGGQAELAPDLMRYRPDVARLPGAEPPDAHRLMRELVVQLIGYGTDNGWRRLNLGLAPLTGPEDRALMPFWNQLGGAIARHGEHFASFEALRAFKHSFDPEWQARYLASPSGWALPRVLNDVTTLITGIERRRFSGPRRRARGVRGGAVM